MCASSSKIDGGLHLEDPVAYRRDRRKDRLVQENDFLMLRFLAEDAEDIAKDLDAMLAAVPRSVTSRCRAIPLRSVAAG
jgi:hypothetical protein